MPLWQSDTWHNGATRISSALPMHPALSSIRFSHGQYRDPSIQHAYRRRRASSPTYLLTADSLHTTDDRSRVWQVPVDMSRLGLPIRLPRFSTVSPRPAQLP